jgi:hypothetical protein
VGGALLATLIGGEIAIHYYPQPKVKIGTNDEVYYYRRATKEDALALGEALRRIGFFNNRGTSVLLWMGGGPTVISFIVNDGAWDHPNVISNFGEIGRRVATSVGGFPIRVHLTDAGRIIRKEFTVGRATVGTKDVVYYFGSATLDDAKALGQALQTAGYFTDAGLTVTLIEGEGTILSFVVRDGVWDMPGAMVTLDRLARQVAPSIGGLPVELRLLDSNMGLRKEVTVQ